MPRTECAGGKTKEATLVALMAALMLGLGSSTSSSEMSVEPWQTKVQGAVYPTAISNDSSAVLSDRASGCALSPLDQPCAAGQQRFENGNLVSGYELPHAAFIGVGSIGTLEVPPGQAACCDNPGGWLYVNPPPGSGIPVGCTGTGSMFSSGVVLFQMLRWLDYTDDCRPPASPEETCRFPGAPTGDGCRQLSCFQCTRTNPDDCYCVPSGIMHTATAPGALLGGPC